MSIKRLYKGFVHNAHKTLTMVGSDVIVPWTPSKTNYLKMDFHITELSVKGYSAKITILVSSSTNGNVVFVPSSQATVSYI